MTENRIIENQRRIALRLIASLERQMTPGRPFIPVIRDELAHYPQFGARDRRLYRELIFTWLRFRAWFDELRRSNAPAGLDLIIALAPETRDTAPLQEALGVSGGWSTRDWAGLRTCLAELYPQVDLRPAALLPAWFRGHCPALFDETEIAVQMQRPPLWLRAQRGSADAVVQDLGNDGITATASRIVLGAVRVADHIDLEKHAMVTSGRVEIQDIGSQALLTMVRPRAGERWFDFCAGAGGKSLQLAGLLGAKGRVAAHDVRREALMELKRRIRRAGVCNISIEPVLPDSRLTQFDGVLIDAPCSATGTWRRHPFLRHQTTVKSITQYARQQADLLRRAAPFVGASGRLVYTTCSLSRMENDEVVTRFLEEQPEFALEQLTPLPGVTAASAGWITLMPSMLDGDGYFVASMRRV